MATAGVCELCSLPAIFNQIYVFAFQDKGKSALNLSNVAGIFHILIGGLVLSMIISLSQIVFHAKIKPKKRQVIYGHEKNLSLGVCEQHRPRPACASTQSDQRLCYSHFGKYHI